MHKDRHTRTLVHIAGAEQSRVDHLVQDSSARSVGHPTERGKSPPRRNKNKANSCDYRRLAICLARLFCFCVIIIIKSHVYTT